jgi:NMD protein affecting ribosome stability and mRNA decay
MHPRPETRAAPRRGDHMEKYKERKWSGEKGKKFGHAGRIEDPYRLEEGQEAAVCSQCHALYQGKRWFFDEKLFNRLAGGLRIREATCPTCRKIEDRYPEGILNLSGEFFSQHRDEIVKLLEKEASRVSKRNVMDRLIGMTPEGKDKLVVETTTEKLAQHLGRAVYRAYKGELEFHWSEMNRFVRVYWSR